LIEKMNKQLNGATDINELAKRLNAKVESADNLSFSAYGIPLLGAEPAVIGTVFGMEAGKLSQPVKGKTAVVVVVVDEFVEAPQTTDAERLKMQLMNYLRSRSQNEGFNALKKKANIIDNRGKFY